MTPSSKTVFGFASEKDAAQANALIGEMPGFEDCPLVLRDDGGDWFLECYDGGALGGENAGSLLAGAELHAASIAVDLTRSTAQPRHDCVTRPTLIARRLAMTENGSGGAVSATAKPAAAAAPPSADPARAPRSGRGGLALSAASAPS